MAWILRANDYKQAALVTPAITCKKNAVIFLSLKKLAVFWMLAAVSLLIPILHFVLVPAFFFIGIFMFMFQYKNTHMLEAGTGSCPTCLKNFSISEIYIFDGKKINCELCMEQLTLINQRNA